MVKEPSNSRRKIEMVEFHGSVVSQRPRCIGFGLEAAASIVQMQSRKLNHRASLSP